MWEVQQDMLSKLQDKFLVQYVVITLLKLKKRLQQLKIKLQRNFVTTLRKKEKRWEEKQ